MLLKVKVPAPALVTIVSVLMTPEISESELVVVTESVPMFATIYLLFLKRIYVFLVLLTEQF